MKILITGGAGFLGKHTTQTLLNHNHSVLVYDLEIQNLMPAVLDPSLQPVQWVKGDIQDKRLFEKVVADFRPKVILHLATILTPACEVNPPLAVDVNVKGSVIVFNTACKYGVQRVLFGSSVAVFDNNEMQRKDDYRICAPSSMYGYTKMLVEQLAGYYKNQKSDTDFLGLRFGWIYGPGRDRGWREVQEMIEAFARRDPEVRFPDFQAPMDWTYVEDAVQAVLCTLDSPKSERLAYNISGDYRRIQEAVAYLNTRFPTVKTIPYAAMLPPVGWQFQSDGIVEEAGFHRKFSLEAGLDKYLQICGDPLT